MKPCGECGQVGDCGCVDRGWQDDMDEVNAQAKPKGEPRKPRGCPRCGSDRKAIKRAACRYDAADPDCTNTGDPHSWHIKDPAAQRRGKHNRRKGGKGEREVLKLLLDAGVDAVRGYGDRRSGDVRVQAIGKIEVKYTKNGFPRIERSQVSCRPVLARSLFARHPSHVRWRTQHQYQAN